MPRVLLLGAALLLGLAPGCGSTKTVVRTTTVTTALSPMTTGEQWLHGEVRFVRREGDHYLLGLDPSWFTSGITANVAQAQDQHRTCTPAACRPVDNDNYIVDDGHRVLTFVLPPATRGTVLASSSDQRTIGVAELARLVAGTSTVKTFEPLQSGVWLLIRIDTVQTFAQQYVP